MILRAALATLSIALPAAPAAVAPAAPANGLEEPEVVRADEWPELSGRESKQAEKEVSRLRKARTEEMGAEAHAALAATGAGVAPLLLKALEKEKDAEARARVVGALEAITSAEHTRLLAEEFGSRSPHVRTWCLERCARFPDPALAEPAAGALDAAEERLAKSSTKELARERYAAALCLTSAGGLDGLDVLFDQARSTKAWGRDGAAIRRATETLRGPEATARVLAQAKGQREWIVAGLRLLAGCGDDSARAFVRAQLGSSDNAIRVAAINAARGIVDGDPPVRNLPVFEAVDLAKRWQQKL